MSPYRLPARVESPGLPLRLWLRKRLPMRRLRVVVYVTIGLYLVGLLFPPLGLLAALIMLAASWIRGSSDDWEEVEYRMFNKASPEVIEADNAERDARA